MDTSMFSQFDSIPVQVISADIMKSSIDLDYQQMFYMVVERIKPAIISSTCRIACSFGKDSNLVLSTALEAHRQALVEHKIPADKPFIVTNIDTGVDDVFVRSQIVYEVAELTAYCKKHSINLVYRSALPPLRYSWSVMYLSGLKLPSFAKSSADCSVILKIDPARSLEVELSKQYGDIVTILGVRSDESTRRSASIKRHGLEDVSVIVKEIGGKVVRTLAPIVDLATEDVFAILRRSGTSPIVPTEYPIPTFKAHNKLLIKLYGDAQETCPVSSFQPAAEAKSGSCGNGSRFGCYTCLKVVKDRSGDSRERFMQYERVRYVKLIRDWMSHNSDNMSLRTPMGKSLCPTTGAIVVQENTYSAQTLEKLIWWFSMATREDYLFVENFKVLVAEDRLMEDAGYAELASDSSIDDETKQFYLSHYVEASSIQFIEPLTIEHIMMICAIHARDGIALPPYRALFIWNAVWNGETIDWPVISGEPIVDPVPEPRFYMGDFKKTASSKLMHILSDETSCSVKSVFPINFDTKHVVSVPVAVDFKLKSAVPALKFAFSKRKIISKKMTNGIVTMKKGRMSVSFDSVSAERNSVKSLINNIEFAMPVTGRALEANIDIWSNKDVEAGFSLDNESLEMFLMTDYDRCLEKHDAFVNRSGINAFGGTAPFLEMVNYGLIKLTQRSMSASERMLARTEQLCNTFSGVSLLNMSKEDLAAYTVDQKAFRTIKAKCLLSIRATRNQSARNQSARNIKSHISDKNTTPDDYVLKNGMNLIASLKPMYKHLIVERARLIALADKNIKGFDGILVSDYLFAIDFSINQMITKVCSIDAIINTFGLDKSSIPVRKSAALVVDAFNAYRRSAELAILTGEEFQSMWSVVAAFNKVEVNGALIMQSVKHVNSIHKTGSVRNTIYQSRKGFSITSLPIFGMAS